MNAAYQTAVLHYAGAALASDSHVHEVNVPELLKSKLLITGGSGSGKSRQLRSLLEQLAGKVQQIVFDFEGDLVTLTEVHDYLVAGEGGHVPAHPDQAGVLAERVMAIGASIICNLSELTMPDRQAFVRNFLGAMMSLPREQWRPCIIAIDEVQLACPERTEGDPVSADAVVDMAARGRKRGYCLVVTSQRIAKVRKDLVAECHNRLVGFISLPADMVRAANELGLEAKHRGQLKQLARGEFYAIGPALSRETMRVRNADVVTREPASGTSRQAPAPASVQALLEQIGELPAIEEVEASTPKRAPAAMVSGPTEEEIEARIKSAVDEARDGICSNVVAHLKGLIALIEAKSFFVTSAAVEDNPLPLSTEVIDRAQLAELEPEPVSKILGGLKDAFVFKNTPSATPLRSALGKTPRRILAVLNQLRAIGEEAPSRSLVAAWTGMSATSGTFRNYLSELRTAGAVETAGDRLAITPFGSEEASAVPPFSSLRTLHDHWLKRLGKTPGGMLRFLIAQYPRGATRDETAAHVGVSATSGTFRNYLSELRVAGLILTSGNLVSATKILFPKGLI